MSLGSKVAMIGATFGLGVLVGTNLPSNPLDLFEDSRYSIVREYEQPMLVDNMRNARVPIYEESGQIQCGDAEYRVKGLINKGYDSIVSMIDAMY